MDPSLLPSPFLPPLAQMFPQFHVPITATSTLLFFPSPTPPNSITLGLAVNFPHSFPYRKFSRDDTHVVTWDGFDWVFELHTSTFFKDLVRKALEDHAKEGKQQWESRSGAVEGVRDVFIDSVNEGFRETGCVDVVEAFGEAGKWVERGSRKVEGENEGIDGVVEGSEKEEEEEEEEEETGDGSVEGAEVGDFTFEDEDDKGADEGDETDGENDDASRYSKDFKEIKILGSGGGGSVWKVRNRLDRRLYAIKKITLLPNTNSSAKFINEKLKEEVSMLAGMEGRWVVRYYQGWVEGGRVEYGGVASGSQVSREERNDDLYSIT